MIPSRCVCVSCGRLLSSSDFGLLDCNSRSGLCSDCCRDDVKVTDFRWSRYTRDVQLEIDWEGGSAVVEGKVLFRSN